MAVLSNKPVNPSRDIVRALGLGGFLRQCVWRQQLSDKEARSAGRPTILRKPASPPDEALMVGDSSVDVLTGRNAGMWTCGVTYGFAPHTLENVPPDVLVESPRELRELLL